MPTLAAAVADKIGPLAGLYDEFMQYKTRGDQGAFKSADATTRLAGSDVYIEAAGEDGAGLLADLRAIGLTDGAAAGRQVSGLLPIAALPEAAALPSLRLSRPVNFVTRAGLVTSQGDAAISAPSARSTYGLTGAGVTVGILSDSFNLGGGAGDIANGDLPTSTGILYEASIGTDEGRAIAQIVHDVAPGASIAFATAAGGQANFANHITALRTVAGAKVIVDDAFYLDEPMFQDGVVAQAVQAAYANGVSYFSSAGNEGRNGYESAFRAGPTKAAGAYASVAGAPAFASGVLHDFDSSGATNTFQNVTVAAGATVEFAFQWDQPFYSVPGSAACANNMDAYLLNSANKVVAGATTNNVGGDAYEHLAYTNASGAAVTLKLMLVRKAGANPGLMKYVAFGLNTPFASSAITDFATNSGTVYGHTNVDEVEAVGADDSVFESPMATRNYSSWGNTPVLFSTAGARLATQRLIDMPDFTAPDDVNTTLFGVDATGAGFGDNDPDTFPNFAGTSAAAPHAAGAVALILQLQPTRSPSKMYVDLESTAFHFMTSTYDLQQGAGHINALGAGQHAVANP